MNIEILDRLLGFWIERKLPKTQTLYYTKDQKREWDVWLKAFVASAVSTVKHPDWNAKCDVIVYAGYTIYVFCIDDL